MGVSRAYLDLEDCTKGGKDPSQVGCLFKIGEAVESSPKNFRKTIQRHHRFYFQRATEIIDEYKSMSNSTNLPNTTASSSTTSTASSSPTPPPSQSTSPSPSNSPKWIGPDTDFSMETLNELQNLFNLFQTQITVDILTKQYLNFSTEFKKNIVDEIIFLKKYIQEQEQKIKNQPKKDLIPKIIFEGAQGILLDKNFGFFPFVTKSNVCPQKPVKELLETIGVGYNISTVGK